MTNKKKCIILDTDDVLLDYTPAFGIFSAKHYNCVPVSELPFETGYDVWLNVTSREIDRYVEHFNEQSWEFGTLKPIQNAIECVQFLSGMKDTDLVVVSKCGTRGHAVPLRNANLVNVFGDVFKSVHIIEYWESKYATFQMLQDIYDVRAVVDDNIHNIDDAVKLGIPAFLFERVQNKALSEPYTTYATWDELTTRLIKQCK